MGHENNKPLYSLTIGEFTELMKTTMQSIPSEKPQASSEDKEEHFSINQLMEFLDCTKTTIHNYKNRGLPYYRIGRKLIFKKSEVLDFMRKNVKRSSLHTRQ
jgi:hypothetical protein